jgi:hypothetical protein
MEFKHKIIFPLLISNSCLTLNKKWKNKLYTSLKQQTILYEMPTYTAIATQSHLIFVQILIVTINL